MAEGAEEYFAALDDFLGGDVTKHFARGCGPFAKEFAELGLGDDGEEHEMAMGEAGDAFDYFGSGGGFGEVGEPDDEAAALLKSEQGFGGALMVGFEFFAFYLGEAFE